MHMCTSLLQKSILRNLGRVREINNRNIIKFHQPISQPPCPPYKETEVRYSIQQ